MKRACPVFRACEAAIDALRKRRRRQDSDCRFREKLARIACEERWAAIKGQGEGARTGTTDQPNDEIRYIFDK